MLLGTQKNDILDGGDGDDILLADYGDDILRGGNGNDSLNGESGNDLLYGDASNDILIGGNGADALFGGFGEDILIGGSVLYFERYSIAPIRDAILTVWASAASYADRVVLLRDTGLDGSSKLMPGSTVFNDGEIDTLFGESGLDWFFASVAPASNEVGLLAGGLQGLEPGEVLTLLT